MGSPATDQTSTARHSTLTIAQDRDLPPLLSPYLPLQRHHLCAQRCKDLPLLSLKMPQEFQDEETAQKAEVDQDTPSITGEGDDCGSEPTSWAICEEA